MFHLSFTDYNESEFNVNWIPSDSHRDRSNRGKNVIFLVFDAHFVLSIVNSKQVCEILNDEF